MIGPASEWLTLSPESISEIERKLRVATRPLAEVSRATKSVEDLVDIEGAGSSGVQVDSPGLLSSLLSGTQNFVSYGAVVIVLLYFLLAGGDSFLRKLVTVLPQLSDKIRAVEIARRTEHAISRYLFTICLINLGLGIAVGSAMWALDMPNPVLWGAVAGGLNFIPFLGPAISTALIAGAAILSFDTVEQFLMPPLACAALTIFEGLLVTPTLLGRNLTLSPVVIFLAVLALSWAWGILGALMAVPTLVMVKIVCDEVGMLRPLGIMMEAEPRP